MDFYDKYIYWVVHKDTEGDPEFLLGRCDEKTRESCEILQSYPNPEFHHMNLDVDPMGDELFVFFDGKLINSMNDTTKEYGFLDTVAAQISFNFIFPSIYSISSYKNGDSYEYILYQCSERFSWCEILPFYYSTPNQEEAVLAIDESKKGLLVTINDVLIFTYDENPRCHVEGCEIFDETKRLSP